MSLLLTQAAVITYVRTMLGAPVINVELTDEQIVAVTNQALGIYGTYKPSEKIGSVSVLDGVQKYDLTADQIGKGIIDISTPDIMRQPIGVGQFDVFSYHTMLPNLDPADYYLERQWWKEVMRVAGSDDDWDLVIDPTDGTGILYISPIPSESYTAVYLYVTDPTLTEIVGSDDDWMLDYILARSKRVLGLIRRKYASVRGAEDDISLDGNELISEGRDEQAELETYLTDRGQIVPPIRG